MLSPPQVAFYHEQGYLHIPGVFTSDEMDGLEQDLERLLLAWAQTDMGWTGPWRKVYMDEATEKASKLTHLHDLQFYSGNWNRALAAPSLTGPLTQLLGPNVELHHTTLHLKPPETGHPFPLHQDNPFYTHTDGRYVDVLVHLDDTSHANGEIRFLPGSHLQGPLPHVTETEEGPCTPHLPPSEYRLEDTEPVSAKRGDVVCFNLFTVHGSYTNTTSKMRRLVRCGYRDPENRQISGQSCGRPGMMVAGVRPCPEGALPFSTEILPAPAQ